jgi:predicted nucleic acid-binding protein
MIALDTNVLVYACDQADLRRQARALELIRTVQGGVLLWQVACEFVAASRKLEGQGFTAVDAWDRLAEYLAVFPLVLPTPGVLERARPLHGREGWSFWDAMIVAACLECNVTCLYSEDLPGRTVPAPLEIINPFA